MNFWLQALGLAVLYAAGIGALLAFMIWAVGPLYPRPKDEEVDVYDDGRWGGHP